MPACWKQRGPLLIQIHTLFIKHRCAGLRDGVSLPESESTSSSLLHLGRTVPAKHFVTGLITGEAKREIPILWSRKEEEEKKKDEH
jgi:hypothetical protein